MHSRLRDLTAVADEFPAPVFLLEVDGEGAIRFAHINRFHEEKSGIDGSMLVGKTPHEVFPARLADTILRNYRRCIERRATYSYEEVLHLPGGEAWWQTTLSPLMEEGHVFGVLGIAHDVTASKRTEEKFADAAREVGRINTDLQLLTSTTAHDLRGPLRQAMLVIDMLAEGFQDLGDNKFELIETGRSVIDKALELIDTNLGHVARAGSLDTGPAQTDFGHWCSDIVAILDPLARLEIDYPELTLECEQFVLDIGLRNIIDNAVKHADSHIVITVAEEGDNLIFTVADDGLGFSGPDCHIGQPPPSAIDETENSGFGLTATRSLIDARGGRFWLAEPRFAKGGATLSFTVPGRIAAPNASDGAAAASPIRNAPANRRETAADDAEAHRQAPGSRQAMTA